MELEIWTDGACVGNPGPGGYGIILKCLGQKWEKAGGFRLTTNNRMEIMGALVALETISEKCKVIIHTDSRYVVDSIMQGWAKVWRSKGWKRRGNKKVPNADLWERILQLCAKHDEVEFRWVKGHDNNIENERCDQLAESAARKFNLPVDEGYTSTGNGETDK
ncbi:ribonuclease HI [Chloroflexota bacterium]